MSRPPAAEVLRAFGAGGEVTPLAGGQGSSWLTADLVLKHEHEGAAHAWLGANFGRIEQRGFRLAEPVPTVAGAWTCQGWTATRFVRGQEPNHRRHPCWAEIVAAGRDFHQAVVHLPRPGFVASASHWWAVADRAAWDEEQAQLGPGLSDVADRLKPALTPLGAPQLVHCDLTGNVLLDDERPPAIIDLSLYWRPPEYAEGVVVADALCWHDAPASLRRDLQVSTSAVARALLFRLHATHQRVAAGIRPELLEQEIERYAHAVVALGL